ncbi:protein TIPIN homolog [Phlebotomus papatasi]|uniref:protein TIPIN homolog n=1 Tax=Phlebotomus papatasi TaxID=29031 RepID=UPI0024834D29|nr:protein TIPIN homolog [Phlebotomus papatasi]
MYEFEENPISTEDNYDVEDGDDEQDHDEKENNGELPTKPSEDGVKVNPKKKVVRNPRVNLNTAKLKGDRGLHTIEEYFRDVKYKGKGHEAENLNLIMRKIEHWGHRVFPQMRFADFVNRVEQLCRKNDVQTHMRKYKMGTLTLDIAPLNDELEERPGDELAEPIDDFDALLSEQVEMQRNVSARPDGAEPSFNSTLDFPFREDLGDVSLGVAEIPPTPPPVPKNLTDEAKARIAENRRAALERLRAKQAAQAAERTEMSQEISESPE